MVQAFPLLVTSSFAHSLALSPRTFGKEVTATHATWSPFSSPEPQILWLRMTLLSLSHEQKRRALGSRLTLPPVRSGLLYFIFLHVRLTIEIWENKELLQVFVDVTTNSTNSKFHPNIKFTAEISENEITFLDTVVFKGERFNNESILDIKSHYKPTETFQWYTHLNPCHPPGVKNGIKKGEAKLKTNS